MSLPDRSVTGRDAPACSASLPRPPHELGQLDRMSADELRLLVKMEWGWGPSIPHNPYTAFDLLYPQDNRRFSTGNTQGCPTSTTQAIGGPVGCMDYTRVIHGAAL